MVPKKSEKITINRYVYASFNTENDTSKNVHPYACISNNDLGRTSYVLDDLTDSMRGMSLNGSIFECDDEKTVDHPWSRYYMSCTDERVNELRNMAKVQPERMLDNYCIHQAATFRKATLQWLEEPFVRPKGNFHQRPLKKGKHLKCTKEAPDTAHAVYRIVESYGNGYLLTPVHREIYGPDRVDLRAVRLTNDAIEVENKEHKWIDKLFVGDLIFVLRLSPTCGNPKEKFSKLSANEDMNVVFKKGYKPLWKVEMFSLIERTFKNRIVTQYSGGNRKNVSMCGYGMERPLTVNKKLLPNESRIDHVFDAQLFLPIEIVDRFIIGIKNNSSDHALHKEASKILPYPDPTIKVFNVRKANQEQLQYLTNGLQAFSNYKRRETALKSIQFSNTWAASMMATIANSCNDFQVYHAPYNIVLNVKNKDVILKFKIKNQNGPPSIKLWQNGTKIEMILQDGRIKGIVQTSLLEKNALEITVRLPKFHADRYRTKLVYSKDTALVTQTIIRKDAVLHAYNNCEPFEKMDDSTNSYKIIEAMCGGKRINGSIEENVCPYYVIQNNVQFTLDKYQSQYIHAMTRNLPAIVANSPFGCGKTTMMSVATNVCCERSDEVQLMISVTNSAVVNLIEACVKNQSKKEYKILRIISEGNHRDVEENCQTEYDLPILMEQEFLKFIKLRDAELQRCEDISPTLKEYFEYVLLHCLSKCQIDESKIKSDYGRKICTEFDKKRKRANPMESIRIFIELYKPRRIACTLTTALRTFSSDPWMGLKTKIGTVQVDEASQLQQTSLIALLITIPNGRFSLVGDYRQLPPYVPLDATSKAKKIASGDTLKRMDEMKLVPSVVLRYVYRSHPLITQTLSKSFYQDSLLSNIKPKDRALIQKFKWWNNKKFPFAIVDNKSTPTLSGTSLYNTNEQKLVEKIIKKLKEAKVDTDEIGVAAFYKSQGNRLQNANPTVLCGTVDTFQGREKDIMIICMTKNNGELSQFLLDKNRINVALSRAKSAVIIIGNVSEMSKHKPWTEIVDKIVEQQNSIKEKVF